MFRCYLNIVWVILKKCLCFVCTHKQKTAGLLPHFAMVLQSRICIPIHFNRSVKSGWFFTFFVSHRTSSNPMIPAAPLATGHAYKTPSIPQIIRNITTSGRKKDCRESEATVPTPHFPIEGKNCAQRFWSPMMKMQNRNIWKYSPKFKIPLVVVAEDADDLPSIHFINSSDSRKISGANFSRCFFVIWV